MFINENEIRKIIRQKLLKEEDFEGVSSEELGDDKQGGLEVAGEVGGAVATGIATAYAAAPAATIATSIASGGSLMSGIGAVSLGGPPAWGVAAGVAAAAGVAYILLDEGDVGQKVEAILDGSFGAKTQKELKKLEDETRKKLEDAGMTEELENFPSLQHASLKMSDYKGWAQDFWDATKGTGYIGFGMGTDHTKIKKTIQDIGSKGGLMDLAITSVIFYKEYK